MLRNCPHDVVGYACGNRSAQEGSIGQERVETPLTPIVEVEVYSSIVCEDKVSDRIGALDVMSVANECR